MTASPTGKWDDLGVRLLSGACLVVVGTAAMWAGGFWFAGLTVIVCAVMVWELANMIAPKLGWRAQAVSLTAAIALFVAISLPIHLAIGVVAAAAVLVTKSIPQHRMIFLVFCILTLLAGYGLVTFRAIYGVTWLMWLVLIVVATDIFGYFAGRFIGGPKFWPSISPKKTWSGTAAGWVAALAIGYYFWTITDAGRDLLWISVLLSFASQMGDIAESAVKRKMGVKDSSNLIPGHGGLFDRFDGLLAASLYMLIVAQFVVIPVVV